MHTTIPMLLIVATVAFAPQSAAQQARQLREPIASARSGSRIPLDVSLQGLGDAPPGTSRTDEKAASATSGLVLQPLGQGSDLNFERS